MAKNIKRGLMIFPIMKDLNKADGILVKNEGIKNGFRKNKVDIDVVEFNSYGIERNNVKFYEFPSNKIARVLSYQLFGWREIVKETKNESYDFVWFRVPMMSAAIRKFIYELKQTQPNAKIILEYGYYPFIKELSPFQRILYRLNRANERSAHASADFIITYAGQKNVNNLLNIPINNGIELDNIAVVTPKTDVNEKVNMISVSSLKKWHAYERIVTGLPEYIKQPNAIPVHFNIVGLGPEHEKIAQIASELGVSDYITFHGFKSGEALESIYQDNHLAIGTLGFHRIGITFSSSLKNREYLGKGLPIVVSTPDEDMPDDLPFVKYVPEGEEPIDILSLVKFAKECYQNPDINMEIRKYAEQHVSWESKIKVVIEHLKESKSSNN